MDSEALLHLAEALSDGGQRLRSFSKGTFLFLENLKEAGQGVLGDAGWPPNV